MSRLFGVQIPDNKIVVVALTRIYGIGISSANHICKSLDIDPLVKFFELSENIIQSIQDFITKNYDIEGDLRKKISGDIKNLISIGSYRGSRHIKKLPIKGRTHSNARTRRTGRKIAVAGKKKV